MRWKLTKEVSAHLLKRCLEPGLCLPRGCLREAGEMVACRERVMTSWPLQGQHWCPLWSHWLPGTPGLQDTRCALHLSDPPASS